MCKDRDLFLFNKSKYANKWSLTSNFGHMDEHLVGFLVIWESWFDLAVSADWPGPLAGTPGIVIPYQRQWSTIRERIFTKTRHMEKLTIETFFVVFVVWPKVCQSELAWAKHASHQEEKFFLEIQIKNKTLKYTNPRNTISPAINPSVPLKPCTPAHP